MAAQPQSIPVITSAPPLSSRGTTPAPTPSPSARVSASYPVAVPAGATISLNIPGNNFYLVVASGNLFIRPESGVFSEYAQGTGENANFFSRIEINNRNAFDAVALVFVGWDNFIDNRLILNQSTNPNVAFPTYPSPLALDTIDIPDQSGGAFLDINGGRWLAISRIAILVFNLDAAAVYLLQKADATTGSGVAAGAIYPLTPIRFDFSGDYRITNGSGGAAINAIVSEIYSAIPGA